MLNTAAAQEVAPLNPVVFADVSAGHAWGRAGGFAGGASASFQWGRHLLTGRFTGTTKIDAAILSPFVPIPVFTQRQSMEEVAALYGWRFVQRSQAWSVALGLSHATLRRNHKAGTAFITVKQFYFGLPVEANIKWFKAKKERFRIYGLFPVGRPTGFGGSFGVKLSGSISANSFAALTLSFGAGFHKKYRN